MDYLKLYVRKDNDVKSLLDIVKDFNDNSGMEFGLNKYVKAAFKEWDIIVSSNIALDTYTSIRNLQEMVFNKYFGIQKWNDT